MGWGRPRAIVPAAALVLAAGCSTGGAGPPSTQASVAEAVPAIGLEPEAAPAGLRLVDVVAPRPLGRLSIDSSRAMEHVAALSTIGPRVPGSDEDLAARTYVAAAFEEAGWSVMEEPFALPQGGESANVVAWPGGPEPPYGTPHVVVGGHLDTVAGSPGANDNASGIGVILAVAEALGADLRPALPVVLVAFGAEERQPAPGRPHHVGSEAYAAAHADNIVAMVSVDMVGNGGRTCLCWYAAGPGTLAERLDAVAHEVGVDEVYVASRGDVSDHGSFARRGVPAALLWTGVDARYHSPRDTAEHVRPADLARAGTLLLALLADLTPADAPDLGSS